MIPIARKELLHVQIAILIAIGLQLAITTDLQPGLKYGVALLELLLVFAIGFTVPRSQNNGLSAHRTLAFMLIGLISLANVLQLILVINGLFNSQHLQGKALLVAALAIFITNIIMFSLWYWELDSPGLSRNYDSRKELNFMFPQFEEKFSSSWRPSYFDYLYVSITNSTAFSPTDTLPITHIAKFLMSIQAIVSLLTIVLVTARAVNILG